MSETAKAAGQKVKVAKTAAQRQAAYRARRSSAGREGNGERRLGVWVESGVALALARLARHEGGTQRAVLERLIRQADERVLSGIELDTPQWDAYFGVRAELRSNGG